ncbi:hypothetical protein V7x_54530 [Crateriforma conspicua]|uniref:YHS domain protein n=2 Tax=Planctomycetaceae TaxID=126 RepID=A0A5C6FHK6_9PLAN|nr:hypothetical protein V7x_54530 [Crateriforma conspicua]
MLKKTFAAMAVLLIAGAAVIAADVDLQDVQCVVAPKAAKADKSAEYKEGKVYFCCGNCQGKFAKEPKKFAEKANLQLVSTKQYVQKACPLSGGDINPDTAIKVAGAKVAFCCENCQGKVADAEKKEQMKLVFSDKAFEKAFKKAEPKKE